ncbi:MAG TPA: tetratricopeptide repeat protein, partial [Casimicrobiaceae bacterium]|nr:tetratricopeptide repeat protein [Casimicrobiaceae bacterium]
MTPLLQQAMAHHQRGQLVEAEQLYRAVIAQDPAHFDALHMLGVLCLQRGDAVAAASVLAQAVRVNGQSAPVLCNLGLALQTQQRWQDALSYYDRALALNGSFP